ncbi:MAG: exosortase family protein XrtF [Bacteroidetes bacterium]|nr:exosortase family protein XrtF [Bacteroidota bacterium]
MNWQEFKPTIFFLLKFLGLYLSLNLLYGFYVTSFEPAPDPVTHIVSQHTARILSVLGWQSTATDYPQKPSVAIIHQAKTIVSVYEGCNSVNVMIVFLAFVFSFGQLRKSLLWFVPLGLTFLYAINIARIGLLFLVSLKLPHFLYFSHKYLFTAIIYLFVLLLWIYWIRLQSKLQES